MSARMQRLKDQSQALDKLKTQNYQEMRPKKTLQETRNKQ